MSCDNFLNVNWRFMNKTELKIELVASDEVTGNRIGLKGGAWIRWRVETHPSNYADMSKRPMFHMVASVCSRFPGCYCVVDWLLGSTRLYLNLPI